MLERPTPTPAELRRRRYRARRAKRRMCVTIELGEIELEFLVRAIWLGRDEDGDRRKVGDAVTRMLAYTARLELK
jgi:hypothetical protein